MNKRLVLLAVFVVLGGLLWASGSKDPAAKQIVVGYTVQSMENDFFVSVVEGMKAEAKAKGITLIVSDAAGDASKHVDHINNFIAQKVDAIIISPVDQTAPEGVVANAVAAGISVISLNQSIKGSSAYLLLQEYDYGFMGGVIAGNWLNGKEKDGTINSILNKNGEIEVGIISYSPIASLFDRTKGEKEGITKTYTGKKKVVFVSEQDAADSAGGLKVAETAFTANPDISIYVCINDSSALGVFEAASALSKKNKDNMCIVGLDGLPQALKYISQDTMFKGTVDIQPVQMGADALNLALDVLKTGPDAKVKLPELKMVTMANIAEYASVIK